MKKYRPTGIRKSDNMYDWLTSKAAVLVAAIVILGVMLGFFLFRLGDFEDRSLDREAQGLAQYLNDITSKDAEFTVHFTFSRDAQGYEMPASVNGRDYEITISTYQVVLTQGGSSSVASILEPVHAFYPPRGNTLEIDDLFRADMLVDNFTIRSGQDFFVESRMYLMPGQDYAAFCYTESVPQEFERLNRLARWIDDFNTYDMTNSSQMEFDNETLLDLDVILAKDVLVAGGNMVAFTRVEHLWKPDPEENVNRSEMNTTDMSNRKLYLPSGNRLVLERKRVQFTGETIAGIPAESVEVFAYDGGAAF